MSSVDESKRDAWLAMQAMRAPNRTDAEAAMALRGGGGGGTSKGMDRRVTRLEVQVEHLDRTLTSIDQKLDRVNDHLNQLPTRTDLRSWQWQWIATGVGIIALTVGGITGGLALIARFAG